MTSARRKRPRWAIGHDACLLDTDAAAAEQAGDWRFAYRRQGISHATTDTLIGAIALAHGAQVVTGNVRRYPMTGVTTLPLPRVR